MTTKLYCYVDESGQNIEGQLFIVGVVTVSGQDIQQCRGACETIEHTTRKLDRKWIRVPRPTRSKYMCQVLATGLFAESLSFAIYYDTMDYRTLIVDTISLALHGEEESKVTVLIDALPASSEQEVTRQLRKRGVRTRKVKGIRREESDVLLRLADALCGLVREAHEGQPAMRAILMEGMETGAIRDLLKKTTPH